MERKIEDTNRIKESKYSKKMLVISLVLLGILNSNPLSAQKETTSQRIKKIHQKIAKEQRKPTAEEREILYPRAPVSHKVSSKKYKIKKVKLKKHKRSNHDAYNSGEIYVDRNEDEIIDVEDKNIDDDKDGIINGADLCPDTPYDVKVDKDGCPIDSDGDEIADYLDLCPTTKSNVKVDEYGCPIDSDGDGLTDDVDQCPEEYGPMEYLGCPMPPDVDWPVIENRVGASVYFGTDKCELNTEAKKELQQLVKFLFENPMMSVRLYGFADSRGSKEYNSILSGYRVANVKKYLIHKGVSENRIMVKKLGEIQESKLVENGESINLDQKLSKTHKVQFETFFVFH